MPSPSKTSVKKKYILLDSCIMEYLLDEHISPELTKIILKWMGTELAIAISEVTYAELIDGAYKSKEEKVKKLLDGFPTFSITKRVLIGSGKLGSLYNEQEAGLGKSASLADRVIAATSVIHDVLIITANLQHFPHPFFNSARSGNVIYSKGARGAQKMISIAALRPNFTLIVHKLETRK